MRAGISGAIVPHKLLASVALLFNDYGGNVRNVFFNRTVNSHQIEGGRAKFVLTPSTSFKATVIAYCVNTRSTPTQDGPVTIASTTAFPSGVVTPLNPVVANAILPVVANHGFIGRTPEQTRDASLKALAAIFQFIDETIGTGPDSR